MKERFNILVEPIVTLFGWSFSFINGFFWGLLLPIELFVSLINFIYSIIVGKNIKNKSFISKYNIWKFDEFKSYDHGDFYIDGHILSLLFYVLLFYVLLFSFWVTSYIQPITNRKVDTKIEPKQVMYQEIQPCNETKNEYYTEPMCYIRAD